MKIINKWEIPGTKGLYELHLVQYTQDKTDYEIWSNKSQRHLKDTTSYGRYKGLLRTYGLKFEDEKDSIQKKIYLKDILRMCEVDYDRD